MSSVHVNIYVHYIIQCNSIKFERLLRNFSLTTKMHSFVKIKNFAILSNCVIFSAYKITFSRYNCLRK